MKWYCFIQMQLIGTFVHYFVLDCIVISIAASSEQVSSNKENVMQAEKAVQIAGKRYEVGKGTVLELNTSQVQLTEAELTYNQSIYDYLVAKADLDQVLGRDYIISNQK